MKAWTVKAAGGRDQLVLEDREKPQAEQGEILIEVKASGVNRLDIIHRENSSVKDGLHPILGVEVSGVVVDNQSDRSDLTVGSHVATIVDMGGHAEYVAVDADRAIHIPEGVDFAVSAAIPENFLTAYQCLYWLGKLKKSETVLIHAAGSGVGTAAIQLAHHLSEAHIIGTAGQQKKLDQAQELGAHVTVNYKEEDFSEKVLEDTDGEGADVILDFIGASYWDKNIASAAPDARWVLIATLGGAEVEVNLGQLLQKRINLHATLLSPRSNSYKSRLVKDLEEDIRPYLQSGAMTPIIHEVLPADQLQRAHEIMENDENIGKIVLDWQ